MLDAVALLRLLPDTERFGDDDPLVDLEVDALALAEDEDERQREEEGLPLSAALFQPKAERCGLCKMRDGHHEVAARIADKTLNSAFIVALTRSAITIVDEVMRQEPAEQLGPLA